MVIFFKTFLDFFKIAGEQKQKLSELSFLNNVNLPNWVKNTNFHITEFIRSSGKKRDKAFFTNIDANCSKLLAPNIHTGPDGVLILKNNSFEQPKYLFILIGIKYSNEIVKKRHQDNYKTTLLINLFKEKAKRVSTEDMNKVDLAKNVIENSYLIHILIECSSNNKKKNSEMLNLSKELEINDRFATIHINKERFYDFLNSINDENNSVFTNLFELNIASMNLPFSVKPEVLLNNLGNKDVLNNRTLDNGFINLTNRIISKYSSTRKNQSLTKNKRLRKGEKNKKTYKRSRESLSHEESAVDKTKKQKH